MDDDAENTFQEGNENDLVEVEYSSDLPLDDEESSEVMELADGMEGDDSEGIPSVPDTSLCTFEEHADSVYCAAINPTIAGLVMTGGGDDEAYIWRYNCSSNDGSHGLIKHIVKLSGHKDTVTSVGFNFDGTLALTGSYDGTVRIWSSETGELKHVLEGPEDIEWAHWHQRGNAILAGSKDGTVWMWMAHNGQCVQVFAGHDGGVSVGCFSNDGKTVCTGGEDGTVRLWAPKTGSCKQVFEGHTGHAALVTCIASSPDGDLLLSGSGDGTVKLFQISGKRLLQSFQHSQPESQGPHSLATEVALPDILEGNSDVDDQRDMDTEFEGIETSLSVECVGFSGGDYRWVASGGLDNTLKIWDTVTGMCRCTCTHSASVISLSWHSNLPMVATAALDNYVRIWDARTGEVLSALTGHVDLVTALVMSPIWPSEGVPFAAHATDLIVTVSDDKTAKIYHINAPELMAVSLPR